MSSTLDTVRSWWRDAERQNALCKQRYADGLDTTDRFLVDPDFRKYQEALTLGPVALREGWLDYLCAEVPDGKGGDFRLRAHINAESFDVEVTELLDAQRERDREYSQPSSERTRRPLRVGPSHPHDQESAEFHRPDEMGLIGKKTEKKRNKRYPERTGLAIYNNVTTVFDDQPGVTVERLMKAVIKHGAAKQFFGIWVVDRLQRVIKIS